jgi:hypothetical protein
MKKAILLMLFILLGIPTFLKAKDPCKPRAELASTVMELRQRGIPMDIQIEKVAMPEKDDETRKEIINIIIDAYEQPRYSVEENIKREINEFRNKHYMRCIKSLPEHIKMKK